MQQYMQEPERMIGIWRRSVATPGFWIRFLLTFSLYYWLLWRLNEIRLTNRRITQRKGDLFSGTEISITIGNISNVTVHQSLLGSLFDFGDVTIEAPGNNPGGVIEFHGLASPQRLKTAIYGMQDWQNTRRM